LKSKNSRKGSEQDKRQKNKQRIALRRGLFNLILAGHGALSVFAFDLRRTPRDSSSCKACFWMRWSTNIHTIRQATTITVAA
jgi:hypothetical protein